MANKFFIIIFSFLFFQNTAQADVYSFLDDKYEDNLNIFCKNCTEDVQLEEEITKFLEEKQTVVSLDECLDIALQNNFDIKAQFETYKSSEYLKKQAYAKFLPNIGYSFYSIYYRGQVLVGTALVDKFDELALSSNVFIEHDLTNGGRQIFEAKEKKFQKREQREKLNYTKEKILMMTANNYWQLLEDKLNIEIHIKNLHERIAQLKLTENLKASGMGTEFDVIRQKNEVANAKRSLIEAMTKYRLQQARLANIMGIELKTTLFPIEEKVEAQNLVDKDIDLDTLFKIAKENRKDLKALINEIKGMKNEKRAILTDFIPKARVIGQYQNEGTANVGLGGAVVIGAYADWLLGENLGVGTIAGAKAKAHEISSKENMLIQQFRDIEEELIDSYYNSKLLLRQIDITKTQVEYATESVTLAEMRFDTGVGILIDIIEAQRKKTNARIEYLQSIIKYNKNQVELLFYQGIIDIDKILKGYNP